MDKRIYLILLAALLLRVLGLEPLPAGFTPDEASFGYDAYSIIKTGSDQWGRLLPFVLESFGDFKAPVYSYLTIPFVFIFDLTKFAVRLPNALIGVLAVLVTYLLTRELLWLRNKDNKKLNYLKNKTLESLLPLIPAFLLAFGPWHVMMSRGAFEANLTTFFLTFGIFLFLKGIRQKSENFILLSVFILGLNLFTYHSAKLVTPLIGIFLLILFRKEIYVLGARRLIFPIVLTVAFVVALIVSFDQGAGRRVADVSIASGALEQQAEARLNAINSGQNPTIAKLFHNKYLVTAGRFFENFRSYWSIDFIVLKGPREATYGMIPGIGVLTLSEGLLLLLFLFSLMKNLKDRTHQLLFFWILVGFVPASLTTGVGHAANRAEVVLPSLQVAALFGTLILLKRVNWWGIRGMMNFALWFLVIFSLIHSGVALSRYKRLSQTVSSKAMLYNNLEVAQWLHEREKSVSKIVVSRKLSEPHIYIAFASRRDPEEYQKNSANWEVYRDMNLKFLDQLPSYNLGNYIFENIRYENYKEQEDVLLVGRPEEFPEDIAPLEVFYYPDNTPSHYVVSPGKQNYASI